jgi:hypothetical protein
LSAAITPPWIETVKKKSEVPLFESGLPMFSNRRAAAEDDPPLTLSARVYYVRAWLAPASCPKFAVDVNGK